MADNISLGEAEFEVMKVIWNAKEAVSTQYISDAVEEKGWKRTTISTFLVRLVAKGAISCEKRGKLYYYTPILSQKEYKRTQTKNLIKNLYGGSVKDFAVALFEDEKLSSEDIKELGKIFDDWKE